MLCFIKSEIEAEIVHKKKSTIVSLSRKSHGEASSRIYGTTLVYVVFGSQSDACVQNLICH